MTVLSIDALPPRPAVREAWAHLALTERRLAILLIVLGAMPLLWPTVPPLTDLPNHMSRYRIGLDYAGSSDFQRWFAFRWVLVGNLGVDLFVTALAPLIGLEPATKLIVGLTPVLAIAGGVLIAHEVHGRVPRTAAFAAVFAYNYPFNFGFVNYTLSVALALLGFGFWLRLGRLKCVRTRACLFVPISCLIWLTHVSGWGIMGLMILSWEIASARAAGTAWLRALVRAGLLCLPLALPLVPMLAWSGRVPHGSLGHWGFDPARKLGVFFLSLRNAVPALDVGSMLAMWYLCTVALIRPDLGYDRRLAAVGLTLTAAYAVMPTDLMGSGHADLRIAPYAMMMLLLAMRPTAGTRYTRVLGIVAIGFFVAQMGYHAIVYARLGATQERSLAALDHLPVGSTVFAFSSVGCSAEMEGNRMDHVHRLAIVRRGAFTNGTWPYPASQTLQVRPEMIAGYGDESSQLLRPAQCREDVRQTVAGALRLLPRERFGYFWLLDTPRRLWPSRSWLTPVWHNDRTILYAVTPPGDRKPNSVDLTPARLLAIDPK